MSIDRPVRRRRAFGCAALLLAAAGVACKGSDATAEEEAAMPVVTARTTVASVEPFTQTLSAIGTVVARPGRYAALSAPSATRIARVYVAEGQRVGAGQPLVEFEQAQFASTSSAAQAALTAAQRNAERAQRLANEGIRAAQGCGGRGDRSRQGASGRGRGASSHAAVRAPIAGEWRGHCA